MQQSVYIIAEAGVNHNGDLGMAKRLVEEAARIGADAIKFQSFRADKLVAQSARKAPYQQKTTDAAQSHHAMLRQLELSAEAHSVLMQHCRALHIEFLSSPFDEESADLLERLGVGCFKIPSGEITNVPLLKHVAAKNKPMIVSTGMSTLEDVTYAVNVIRSQNHADLTLLHCVTEYPAPFAEINLQAMATLRQAFQLPVGYSDHTEGNEIAIAAVALGACVIEKHFTLDRNLPGPDHTASLNPDEFREMIQAIRHVELALGDGEKKPAPCELKNRDVARKSVVVTRDIHLGEALTLNDLALKRPGTGIAPRYLDALVGRVLAKSMAQDDVLQWDCLESER